MFQAALDPYYLGLTGILTVGWQALGLFLVFFVIKSDVITDAWSAFNFFFLALLTLNLGAAYYARNILASIFVMLWAVRLGGFQLFRISKMGGDSRFDDIRGKFLKFAGFWTAQAVWVWTVSTPVTILNSPAVSRTADNYGGNTSVSFGTGCDIVGIIFWVIGFTFETLADAQKYRFKMVQKPPKGTICDAGVWYYSRRPNYFGEMMHWWGIWLLCISPAVYTGTTAGETISMRGHDALLASLISPLFTMLLLMFVSGLPTAEKPSQEKYYLMSHGVDGGKTLEPFGKTQHEEDPWKRMKGYADRTSILLPMPPALYRPLPSFVKTWILLDLPIYKFDEKKDGPTAIENEKKKKNDQAEQAA